VASAPQPPAPPRTGRLLGRHRWGGYPKGWQHRINLTVEKWARLKAGDKIEIISLPGDPDPYTRDDIFVSSGNCVTDLVFLGVELGVAGLMAWQLLRLNKQT